MMETIPHVRKVLKKGDFLSTGEYWAEVASGNTKQIVVENNSTKDMYINVLLARSNVEGTIQTGFNPTVSTRGDPVKITNKNGKEPDDEKNTAAFTAGDNETGVISLDGTNFNPKYVPAGKKTSPGVNITGGIIMVPSNASTYLSYKNISTSSGRLSLDIDYELVPNGEL